MIDVQQGGIAFKEDFELEVVLVRQIGGAVGEGVCLAFGGNGQRGAHALTGVYIPSLPGRLCSGFAPQTEFHLVCARVIAAGDEVYPGICNCLEGFDRGGEPINTCWVISGTHDDKVVVHHKQAVFSKAGFHQYFFSGRSMYQQNIGIAFLAHFDRRTGSNGDGLHDITGLFLEDGNEHIQQAGILCGGGGGEYQLSDGGGSSFGNGHFG